MMGLNIVPGVEVEDVVGGDPARVLNDPAGSLELGIDAFPGFGFWLWSAGVHQVGFTMGEIRKLLKWYWQRYAN